ncbi:TPA: trypsin-like serine protease [Citrobacter freundii]
MHQTLANATFQVIAGGSRGSGFSFISEDIVITNFHVVKGIATFLNGKVSGTLQLRCEDDVTILADIIVVDEHNDFAVLKLKTKLPANRVILQPMDSFKPVRGKKTGFCRISTWISRPSYA